MLWELSARTVAGMRSGGGERWHLSNLAFDSDGRFLAGSAGGYDKAIDWYKSVAMV